VLEAVFVLLEFPSPSSRILIGSHSLPPLCFSVSVLQRFADDMSREYEMSMMGELQFFLGLQIKQSKEGTFVHQAK
jgi:hypothetical protein